MSLARRGLRDLYAAVGVVAVLDRAHRRRFCRSDHTILVERLAPAAHVGLQRSMLLVDDYQQQTQEPSSCFKPAEKRIRWCPRSFSELYELGGVVMPTVHRGMQVLYAKRRLDGEEVVVKIRHKAGSFAGRGDEQTWHGCTDALLNLSMHRGIVHVHEVLEDGDNYYVVMERVKGQDLFETMCAEGLLPHSEVKAILQQLLAALAHLHSAGCVHRDVKLDNIVVSRSSSRSSSSSNSRTSSIPAVRLIDFDTLATGCSVGAVGKSENVLGTNQYIAPEAYAGSYSPASDIFAAGVVGYWLLVGRPPFDPGIFDDEAGENRARSPEMVEVQRRLKSATVAWDDEDLGTGIESIGSLLQCMLSDDPRMRPTAWEALAHPWLQSASKKKHPHPTKEAPKLVAHDLWSLVLPTTSRLLGMAAIG